MIEDRANKLLKKRRKVSSMADIKKTEQNRIIMIDVIKGICIIMVILNHVTIIPTAIRRIILWPFTILPAVPMFIMLSSYNLSLSEERMEIRMGKRKTIADWFENKRFFSRINRFLIPYLITILVLIVGLFIVLHAQRISFKTIWFLLIQGGRGPGGYFVIIILQVLVLFPFLRYGFEQSPFRMTVFMIIFHVLYESLCMYVWNIPDIIFKRLVFHFFTQLAMGMLLHKYQDHLLQNAIPLISIIVGGIYIVNTYYYGYETHITITEPRRNLIASLYSFGVLTYLLQLEPLARRFRSALKPVCYIGKASFHIMLTQMVYYYFARAVHFEEHIGSLQMIILVDLTITLSSGCLFYYLETIVRKKICRA